MSFWDWALAAYGRAGVPEACLALQDYHGQQTVYLLWAAFARPSDPDLAAGAELARHWDLSILGPIRQSRRALKAQLSPVSNEARIALREEVKRVELAAERLLMETLEALAPGGPSGSPLLALLRAGQAWGDPPPEAALQSLADRLA
ncbi:MAG: TIGR02444 family protein [Caulobacter sp.]|nr:TIGR02444 family protein [Caulobacter sp.]